MANTLKCKSDYEYTFIGDSKTGKGPDEKSARAAALRAFPPGAENKVKIDAINQAQDENRCEDPCQEKPNVTPGDASFAPTPPIVDPSAIPQERVSVTLTIQVPVKVSCRERQVAAASVAGSPLLVALTALRAIPISEVDTLSSFRDDLSALGVRNIDDLLREAGRSESGGESVGAGVLATAASLSKEIQGLQARVDDFIRKARSCS